MGLLSMLSPTLSRKNSGVNAAQTASFACFDRKNSNCQGKPQHWMTGGYKDQIASHETAHLSA